MYALYTGRSRNSLVVLATGRQDRRSGVRVTAGARDFSILQNVTPALGPAQLPIPWVLGYLPGGGMTCA